VLDFCSFQQGKEQKIEKEKVNLQSSEDWGEYLLKSQPPFFGHVPRRKDRLRFNVMVYLSHSTTLWK